MTGPTRVEQRRQQALARRLAETGFVLPGSVLTRYMRCGKANCRCHAEPPELHGPYLQWNRMANGKTLTRLLPAELADHYQGWFENSRQLRLTLSELEALSVTIV
ncbi:MAG: DUF6788 family protein, partial [Acidimicrobiales bacterium]